MTTTPMNQPFQPFQVKSSLLADTGQPAGGIGGPRPPRPPSGTGGNGDSGSWQMPGGTMGGVIQCLAAVVFIALYSLAQRYAQVIPVTVAVLVVCTLLRMNGRERMFAAVPVGVAGILLALHMAALFARHAAGLASGFLPGNIKPQDYGVNWLPLFFSVCLFYMPKRVSVTARIVMACSVVLLVAGLLPGDGYVYIFAMAQMMLFVVIGVGLIIDFVPKQGHAANGQAWQGARL